MAAVEPNVLTLTCRRAAPLRRAASAGVLMLAACGVSSAAPAPSPPRDPPQCETVRLPDIGWTDVTATTAVFSTLLRRIGYQPTITVLTVPVAFASLKHRDLDVFLGNWMPQQQADRSSYLKDGSVEVVRANLTGAKYTLAVPAYTYAAGLKSFGDIARFAPQLHAAIYGIEPGNDGNHLVLSMIGKNSFGLGAF